MSMTQNLNSKLVNPFSTQYTRDDDKDQTLIRMSHDNFKSLTSRNLNPTHIEAMNTKESKDSVVNQNPQKETLNKDTAREILTVCNIFLPQKD